MNRINTGSDPCLFIAERLVLGHVHSPTFVQNPLYGHSVISLIFAKQQNETIKVETGKIFHFCRLTLAEFDDNMIIFVETATAWTKRNVMLFEQKANCCVVFRNSRLRKIFYTLHFSFNMENYSKFNQKASDITK